MGGEPRPYTTDELAAWREQNVVPLDNLRAAGHQPHHYPAMAYALGIERWLATVDALQRRAEELERERDRLVEALAAAAIEHDGCDVGGWSICRVDPENDEAEGLEWLALPPGAGSGVAYSDAHDAIRAALLGKAAGDA